MKSITYQVTVDQYHTAWKLNDKLHREDGPAVEHANGDKFWYLNGKAHRVDGPAVEHANGDKFWKLNDKLHRVDGPAVEYANGCKYWYLNDELMTEEEHRAQTQPVVELTMAEIERLIGKRVKIIK